MLEAFWRYGDPALCAALVEPILQTGAPLLVQLLIGELLNPTIGDPLPSHLMQGLTNRRPSLPLQLARRLADRLRDAQPLANAQYEGARHILETWILEQQGEIADAFAVQVVRGETPGAGPSDVRQAAYRRCGVSQRALMEASTAVLARLDGSPSVQTWQMASEFVEVACEGKASPPDPVVPLVEKLLELAPSYAPVDALPPQLGRFAAGPQRSVLERLIGERLPDASGARAILRTVASITHPGTKARLFALAVCRQPHLWGVLQAHTGRWDEATWKRSLKAFARQEPIDPAILTQLMNAAPSTLVANVIKLALSQAQGPGEPPLQTAGQRLRQRLDELGRGSEQQSAWVNAVPWPSARNATIQKLASVLDALARDDRLRLVVAAYEAGAIRSHAASRLLPQGTTYDALGQVRDQQKRASLARSLVEASPDEAGDAIARLQMENFSLEVARALASSLPEAAFAGAAAAFSALTPKEKDSLVELLCSHATAGQITVLEAVVADDRRENAERRARATGRIAQLVSPGSRPPQCVIDLLNSNIPQLRRAAVEAIQAIKPRDAEVIAKLHEVAARGGDPGRAALEALDALAEQFSAATDKATTKDDVRQLIPLLGAVGRPQVLSRLFRFLGARAEYDDVGLHQAAAKAVRQAADHIHSVSEEDQTTLVGLIDGDEREADPEALEDLSAALARIQLGEDAALKILYDEAGFSPRADPDTLFGNEKAQIVRQLGLYARSRDRGEAGWGAALAHLDNVAERLVRAAYLACPVGSDKIKQQIRSDPRRPEYGVLIEALNSVRQLKAVQADCKKLHDIRSKRSEVPHPGDAPDGSTWQTAQHCFREIARVCLGVLDNAARGNSATNSEMVHAQRAPQQNAEHG
ncbi:MAG TPA: hypothetical protein VNM43_02455 [Dehalococcoidia bacterium]|nr:hypothetical protein [Dehalococcoidia bacterium]